MIGRRLSRLGDDCNRMLTVGAAMPGGFTLEVVRRVLDTDEDAVLDLLDEALDGRSCASAATSRAPTSSTTR